MLKKLIITPAIGLAMAGAALAAPAANAVAPGCVSQPWAFLGSQTRQLCDGPIGADGSWMRHRIVGRAGYWSYPHTSCSYGSYSSNCTSYPGGWVPEYDSNDEWYVVTPNTVLPDEPGHIG